VAAREAAGALAPMLRPLGKGTQATGHFHAAAFHYRPIRKHERDLRTTVRTLFESTALQGVLHLLADGREPEGAGESELMRGTCWVAPIRETKADHA
jgi:hypothetical protein